MDLLAEQMSTASFDAMPVPFKPKRDAPVKNMHVLVAPSAETPGAVDIVKFMTFSAAIGYKILGTVCHGECLQLDLPEGGVRSKAARIALHRFLMTVNGTHLTPFSRRRTNVQQLTCKIDLSNSFYYLFFSFVVIELKPIQRRLRSIQLLLYPSANSVVLIRQLRAFLGNPKKKDQSENLRLFWFLGWPLREGNVWAFRRK